MVNEQMQVAQIVLDHSECAGVLTRYRIDYCCKGELPLAEACQKRGADVQAVLADLAGAIAERREPPGIDPREVPTQVLVDHIVKRHHRYLKESLPFLAPLAKKVARVHGAHNPKLPGLSEVVEELSDALIPHIEREEQVLFPALVNGGRPQEIVSAELSTMHEGHLEMSTMLERLRTCADDFFLPEWACTSYTTLFRELETMEADLFQHVHLENHVLMPRFAHPKES